MKTCEGMDVYIHVFLISALAEDEWPASRSCRFTLEELDRRQGGTHSDVKKREFLALTGLELQPLSHPARSQSLY
jgi:hypothetical protein